jgi:POLQ-like helicase
MKVEYGISDPNEDIGSLYEDFVATLQRAATKWFAARGVPTDQQMSYCLQSRDLWSRNIICNDVVEYIRVEQLRRERGTSFPLHKYIHHGLSSQAMLFNLLGPLIVREDLAPLRTVLVENGIDWPVGAVTARFEYEDRKALNENSGQPTSFDAAIIGENKPIFIEAKFIERKFGGCSAYPKNCDGRNRAAVDYSRCYLYRKGRRYWDLMYQYGIMDETMAAESVCPFVANYQFYRELLFALVKGGSFVLLSDARNPVFAGPARSDGTGAGLWHKLIDTVPSKYHDRLAMITVQRLVREIQSTGRHDDWIMDFARKYAMADPAG